MKPVFDEIILNDDVTNRCGYLYSNLIDTIQVTDVIPYVENNQILGILAGMPGAAQYEKLVENELNSMGIYSTSGKASSMMSAQSIAHIVIVLFIILGNISYFIKIFVISTF